MSVKIYDGLRLNEGIDVFEAVSKIDEIARNIAMKRSKEVVFYEIAAVIDNSDRDSDDSKSIFFIAEDNYKETNKGNEERFSISFGKAPDGRILAYPFFSDNSYMDALLATEMFEKYGYWNNTDEPEDVSEEDWVKRRDDWFSLTVNDTFASLLSYTVPSRDIDPFINAIFWVGDNGVEEFNEMFTPEKRAKSILVAQVYKRLLAVEIKKNLGQEAKDPDWFKWFFKARDLVDAFILTEDWKNLPRPEKLAGNFAVSLKELPEVFKFDNVVIDKVISSC